MTAGTGQSRRSGGAKFSHIDREQVKAKVAELDRKGYNQYQIAAQVGVSQGMVSNYIRQIKEAYKEYQFRNLEESIAEKVDQHRDVRKEAWEFWETTKGVISEQIKEAVQEAIEDSSLSGNPLPKEIRVRLIATPEIAALNVVLKTLKDESELLGLIQKDKSDVNVNVGVGVNVNIWDWLSGVVSAPIEDRIEGRINTLLQDGEKTKGELVENEG